MDAETMVDVGLSRGKLWWPTIATLGQWLCSGGEFTVNNCYNMHTQRNNTKGAVVPRQKDCARMEILI